MKLSPASAAIPPTARPVSTHSTASTVSSAPKKAVIVGTLGRKLIDRKESMESMSTPYPVEPPAQPLPPLNVKPIEAESEKQNQTAAPVPVEILTVPVSAPVAEPPVSNTSTVITILPKANSTVSATNTRKQVARRRPRAWLC
jgi:hypothetical protein